MSNRSKFGAMRAAGLQEHMSASASASSATKAAKAKAAGETFPRSRPPKAKAKAKAQTARRGARRPKATTATAACKRPTTEAGVGIRSKRFFVKLKRRGGDDDTLLRCHSATLMPDPNCHIDPERVFVKRIRLGSDCSGLSAESVALRYAKVHHDMIFASERDPSVRQLHTALYKGSRGPNTLHHTVEDSYGRRDFVHLYVAGPPCQPFSSQGAGYGLADLRGDALHGVLNYIERHTPPVVVLENVKGMVDRHTKCLQHVLRTLEKSCGYSVTWKIVQTCDHGIPHSRSRLYVVALKKVFRPFAWPVALKVRAPLVKFLDIAPRFPSEEVRTTDTGRKNLLIAKAKLKKASVDINTTCCVVDLHAAPAFSNHMVGMLPCLTATRGAQGGFYLTDQRRFTTIFELGRLQGWKTEDLQKILTAPYDRKFNVTRSLGKALGNGMSVNLLCRILPRALFAAGLLKHKCDDAWKHVTSADIERQGFFPDIVYDTR